MCHFVFARWLKKQFKPYLRYLDGILMDIPSKKLLATIVIFSFFQWMRFIEITDLLPYRSIPWISVVCTKIPLSSYKRSSMLKVLSCMFGLRFNLRSCGTGKTQDKYSMHYTHSKRLYTEISTHSGLLKRSTETGIRVLKVPYFCRKLKDKVPQNLCILMHVRTASGLLALPGAPNTARPTNCQCLFFFGMKWSKPLWAPGGPDNSWLQ